ncbi:MAG: regulatory protein RecX [Candidatus Omnitrophota bacterium]|nr:regulatory protein RecX [Candidatus Omnitrophota bacterium]MDD5654835.1 regulatory protein RecX [Candidatus Omnitrophota bacterium]
MKKKSSPGSVDLSIKARQCAFRLLKFRLRSEDEIRQRLKRKKIPADIIEQTLAFLKEKEFLDDGIFTRLWLQSRLRRRMGFKRITRELKDKGISPEIIQRSTGEIKKEYNEEKVVLDLARERMEKLKNVEKGKARQRLYAWLLRRGFSPEVVFDAVNKICKPII